MNAGLNPHWGAFITERRVGELTTFALARGFRAIELTIEFRMLEAGLQRAFNRSVFLTLQSARRRGLGLHIGIEPYESHLSSWRGRRRTDSLNRTSQIIKFLQTTVSPQFVFVHPGRSDGKPELGAEYLLDSIRELQSRFPSQLLGVKVGEEGEGLKTTAEISRLVSRLPQVNLVLDATWVFSVSQSEPERMEELAGAVGDRLFSVHWRNLSSRFPGRGLPLGKGALRESEYLKLMSLLPLSREIWHVLDYRDRLLEHYAADKLMLEELEFLSRKISPKGKS